MTKNFPHEMGGFDIWRGPSLTVSASDSNAVSNCRVKVSSMTYSGSPSTSLTDGAIVVANDGGGNHYDLGHRPIVNAQSSYLTDDDTIITLSNDKMPLGGKLVAAESANITGLILEQSTLDGADFVLKNNSNFTMAFHATPATSHISGAALTIPAYGSQRFTYSTNLAMWVQA